MKRYLTSAATALLAIGSFAAGQVLADATETGATTPKAEAPVATQSESGAMTQAAGTVDDAALTVKVKAALVQDPATKAGQINVETSSGVVQLSGFVDSKTDIDAATHVAESVDGVVKVQNQLQVKPAP